MDQIVYMVIFPLHIFFFHTLLKITFSAAGKIGTVFTLSTIATTSIEEIASKATDTLRFFQLYIYKDRYIHKVKLNIVFYLKFI